MKVSRFTAPSLAVALLTTLPGFASNITLPSASSVTECTSVSGTVFDDPFGCSAGGGVAQATLLPFAGVFAEAPASQGTAAGGFASLVYYFEVIGGSPGDVVPLLFTSNLATIANSTSNAFASITVTAAG